MTSPRENWGSGEAYEQWVGRWSRPVARMFLDWLAVPPGAHWADIGCGTGALSEVILARDAKCSVQGIDRSATYVAHAAAQIPTSRASFEAGDAMETHWPDARFDATVSGLVLNFVPSPERMATEMKRVTREGGCVAAYVWDYGGGMQMLRNFWDVILELHPGDSGADQAERFPICDPKALAALFGGLGLKQVATTPLDFTMVFRDFDDYWRPFLGKQGSAPTYLASLPAAEQELVRETLRVRLRPREDGTIALGGRAWAVKAVR